MMVTVCTMKGDSPMAKVVHLLSGLHVIGFWKNSASGAPTDYLTGEDALMTAGRIPSETEIQTDDSSLNQCHLEMH